MMVDDMCVFSILPCDHIKYPPSLHWAPKMTKFNTKPGSSRRCSISGQREDDDSIMTTWLLDFTILSRKSHAVPKCANPWGLGNVHQFLCCFPYTNVAYRTYRTSTDFTDPMDPTHIGRMGTRQVRPSISCFTTSSFKRSSMDIPSSLPGTGAKPEPLGALNFGTQFTSVFIKISSKYHEHKTDSGLHVKVCSIMFNLISLRPLLKNLRVWYWY